MLLLSAYYSDTHEAGSKLTTLVPLDQIILGGGHHCRSYRIGATGHRHRTIFQISSLILREQAYQI
jgi:hypothetical protein